MIDRSRPNPVLRRRTWLGALLLSVALAAFAVLGNAPGWITALAGLPLALVALAFLGTLFLVAFLGTSFRYALYRVSECCPWCRLERPLRYRCPGCSTWHDDLRPGFHGLWHARCGVCHRYLATTDRGGRSSYARACGNPQCGRELRDPIGQLPEYHFAVVGREAHVLGSVFRRWEEDYARPNHIAIQFLDPDEEQACRAGGEPSKLTIGLQPANGAGSLLFLSDLTSASPAQRYLSLPRLDGLLFIIDPPREGEAKGEPPGPRNRRFTLTMAVLVRVPPTSEALPVRDLGGSFVSVEAALQEGERDCGTVRQQLIAMGLAPFVDGVERRFALRVRPAAQVRNSPVDLSAIHASAASNGPAPTNSDVAGRGVPWK